MGETHPEEEEIEVPDTLAVCGRLPSPGWIDAVVFFVLVDDEDVKGRV